MQKESIFFLIAVYLIWWTTFVASRVYRSGFLRVEQNRERWRKVMLLQRGAGQAAVFIMIIISWEGRIGMMMGLDWCGRGCDVVTSYFTPSPLIIATEKRKYVYVITHLGLSVCLSVSVRDKVIKIADSSWHHTPAVLVGMICTCGGQGWVIHPLNWVDLPILNVFPFS